MPEALPKAETLPMIPGSLNPSALVPHTVRVEPPPGPEAFDTKGWRKHRVLKNAAPVYSDIVSKDGKHLFHLRFKVGEEINLPPYHELTEKYVQLGRLERLY